MNNFEAQKTGTHKKKEAKKTGYENFTNKRRFKKKKRGKKVCYFLVDLATTVVILSTITSQNFGNK
jgi:cell division protein FtsL